MKNLKCFKILFFYLKEDKFKSIIYVILSITKHFEPLINSFIWAMAIDGLSKGNMHVFTKCLIAWTGIIVFAWVFIQLPQQLLYNKLEKKFMERVSRDLYVKIGDLPAIAHEEIGSGEFVNRLYTDPDRILELLGKLIKLTCRLVIAIIIVFISFTVSYMVGLELILLCIIMFILSNIYYPKIKRSQEMIKKDSDNYIKVATQNINGIREIKALGIKDNINNNIFDILKNLFYKQRKIGVTESLYVAFNNLAYFIIQFCILFTLGYLVVNGRIGFASFLLIERYIWRIDDVVESLSEFGVSYNKVVVSLNRIDEIVNNKLYDDEKFGNIELNDDKITLKFNKVKFKYREEEDYILSGLDMKIEPHKKVAIVGKSGQGKSTIFNLLLRYFDSSSGNITLNNIDIKDLTEESLRNNISIIRQSPFIFNETILENFKLVKKDITLEEVREACKKAYIDDYIMSLPNKYDTLIGEGGINLSGGQKQRLAIARTLIKNTKVILFDEATSALDNSSQEYIKETIDNLVKDHTIIIVAHRLSTIMDADVIHVIDGGKDIIHGKHEELMKKNKLYRDLYSPELQNIE